VPADEDVLGAKLAQSLEARIGRDLLEGRRRCADELPGSLIARITLVVVPAADHMEQPDALLADGSQQRWEDLFADGIGAGDGLQARTPPGEWPPGAAAPGRQDTHRRVRPRQLDFRALPAAVTFTRHVATRIGVELLIIVGGQANHAGPLAARAAAIG